jgi:hypothetical protein
MVAFSSAYIVTPLTRTRECNMLQAFCRYKQQDEHVDPVNEELLSYRHLHQTRNALRPSKATFRGALMVSDITGFTKLTEILSKQGSTGVELLTNCINDYFGKVCSSCIFSRMNDAHLNPWPQ